MWSFCSNSQHQSHFPNKILLQVKSALPNIKTSINQKCNVCFTVCENPTYLCVSSFKREGGRREGRRYFSKWLSGFLPLFPAFLLGVFFSRLPGGREVGRKHLASANGSFIARSPHREKLMTSIVILKKICFLKIYFLMIFLDWGSNAPTKKSVVQEAYIFDMPPMQDFPVLCETMQAPYFIPAGGCAVDTACPVASWVPLLPSVKIKKRLFFSSSFFYHQSTMNLIQSSIGWYM